MASMSPGVAQDERLIDQLSRLSRQEENPKPVEMAADDLIPKRVVDAVANIPVTRHAQVEGELALKNGYQKSYVPFKKGVESKIHNFRRMKAHSKLTKC